MVPSEPAQTSPSAAGLGPDGRADVYDLAVIGGGPAGTHAALKAALLFKTCVLFDKGERHGRIFFATKIDNLPGFPDGISGAQLVQDGYRQIERMEERMGRRFVDIRRPAEVVDVSREDAEGEAHPLFVLQYRPVRDGDEENDEADTVRARNLILATGSVDRQPVTQEYRRRDIETILPYANKGIADYCLLCEGHTVAAKRVAVIGCGRSAGSVAASLKKNFGARTTLVTCGGLHPEHEGERVPEETRAFLAEREIPILDRTVKGWFGLRENQLGIEFTDGSRETFDRGFIAMGWYSVNSELAVRLGAATAEDGAVKTDRDCEAVDAEGEVIRGLFAVGDVRADSWNQIPIAWGEAETAVVHAFANRL